mmetsp:Transcript_17680/g.43766  ORF Transcript_17680/g.43766 Transcript_17680/m.43766 type:complete len:289 (-) Transcript_17680:515-1381(-)
MTKSLHRYQPAAERRSDTVGVPLLFALVFDRLLDHLRHVIVPLLRRHTLGRLSLSVPRRGVRVFAEEVLHHVLVPPRGGSVKRSGPARVHRLQARARLHQHLHALVTAFAAGEVERGGTRRPRRLLVTLRFTQPVHYLPVPLGRRHVDGPVALRVGQLRVRTRLEQHLDDIQVPLGHGGHQRRHPVAHLLALIHRDFVRAQQLAHLVDFAARSGGDEHPRVVGDLLHLLLALFARGLLVHAQRVHERRLLLVLLPRVGGEGRDASPRGGVGRRVALGILVTEIHSLFP